MLGKEPSDFLFFSRFSLSGRIEWGRMIRPMSWNERGIRVTTDKRLQINVQIDEETAERIGRLLASVTAALGVRVSKSDLIRLGLIELERKYPPEGAETPAAK